MSDSTIILTGFMGAGKSTVGRILAELSGREFVDTDAWIENQAGRPINRIFAEDGEAHFRQLERLAAHEFAGREGLVIATGGRLMLDSTNAALLAGGAHVFCLHASPGTILSRLTNSASVRPLIAGDDAGQRIQDLLVERAAAYARFTPIDTDRQEPEQVARLIQETLPAHPIPIPVTLLVTHPAGQYEVIVGYHILSRWRALSGATAPAVIISDSNVGPLHAANAEAAAPLVTMPPGEEHKNLDTVRRLYDQLLHAGLDRSGIVLALGGGVVGDVAGFVAATYLRGLPLIQAPTSLLAMVDAAVGGKTGVDLPQGKNLVGAFKQPELVIVDLALLATLPAVEFAAGMAEVVKSGLIAAPTLFARLETESWNERDIRADAGMRQLQELVAGAIRVKRDIVQDDPYEKGNRALLNLGHTFAHAIEQASRYQLRHGEAVAVGLIAAANLSTRLGFCSPELQPRIAQVLARCNLPVSIPADLSPETLLAAMQTDKKRAAGRLHFVLLRDIGDAFLCGDVERDAVLAMLSELSKSRRYPPSP